MNNKRSYKLRKIEKSLIAAAAFCGILGISGCNLLQESLSSEMKKKKDVDTGTASLVQKNWYYGGVAAENMKLKGTPLSEEYVAHSLKINFSKKVALQELAGTMQVSYIDSENFQVTKTITELQGRFSEDFLSYYLDFSKVIQLLDGVNIPSGVATVELKVGGFVCAEGVQAGRPISVLNQKITVKPLFLTKTVDFSTCWYNHGETSISIPMNDFFVLTGNKEAYKIKKDNIEFEISAGDKELIITPKSDVKGKVTSFEFMIPGILQDACGDSYSETFVVNFVDKAIVIDGKKDTNYDSVKNGAVTVIDAAGDQNAFDHTEKDWVGGMPDITEINLVNDEQNLYIGVGGTMAFNWNDKLILMICKDGDTLNDATASNYQPVEKTSYWKGRPNVYLYHMPGFEDSGKGSFGVNFGASKTNIEGNCKAAPYGWTQNTNSDFIEYSIPLSVVNFKKGDKLKIIAAASLNWNEGLAACDVVPDSAIRKEAAGRTEMQFDFEKAIEYEIQ